MELVTRYRVSRISTQWPKMSVNQRTEGWNSGQSECHSSLVFATDGRAIDDGPQRDWGDEVDVI